MYHRTTVIDRAVRRLVTNSAFGLSESDPVDCSGLLLSGGELTPTLKLKRGPVADKYSDIIDKFYAQSG